MKKSVEYIIVGDGYAALFFAHQLILNGNSFVLFSEVKKSASHVSAGVINPVVLKRFSAFWKAQEQIKFLEKTMVEIAQYLPENYFINEKIHRIFHDEKEREIWKRKRISNALEDYLDEDFTKLEIIANPHETGTVHNSGRISVSAFFSAFFNYMELHHLCINERFEHQFLNIKDHVYLEIQFQKIVFCEGVGVQNNPYFQDLPITPNKGHYIIVRLSVPLQESVIIKKKHFLFHVEKDLYYYGGTYDPNGSGETADEPAKMQLTEGLEEFYTHPYEIVEFSFGYRPTVEDRRPILGNHATFKNLYVFNGLGARGILNGSYFAHQLYDNIENGKTLSEEILLDRF